MQSLNTGTSHYHVKSIETVMAGTDVQARVFTLGPGEVIPWHYHSESADHYFVLAGALTVQTREPEETSVIGVGEDRSIPPRTAHLIANRSQADCRFLLLQGVGKYDWIKLENPT